MYNYVDKNIGQKKMCEIENSLMLAEKTDRSGSWKP